MPTRNSVCRAIITATITLFLTLASARADDPQALKDRLHAAEKDTSLDGDDVQPFYLKMSVQLFDNKSAPSEQGTVEIFWANTHKQKLIYSLPSYAATEVRIDNKVFRTSGSSLPPEMATLMVGQALHPMPQDPEIDNASLQMQNVSLGKLPLDCIRLGSSAIGSAPLPIGLLPTYCLGHDDNAFRAAFHPGGQIFLRNALTLFQQKHVAFDVTATTKGLPAAEGKIATLEQRAFADSDFSTDGLPIYSITPAPFRGEAPKPSGLVRISSDVMAGFILSHMPPVYPPGAKAMRVQGTVVLHAQIGKDGHIRDLQVVSTPDTELAAAALDAVRQWTYRPYMLNGSPVAVDTTINVNFTFGR